jgi:homoserine dehydrogenase
LWRMLSDGNTFEDAVALAQEKSFLEPSSAGDSERLVNGELEDVFRKAVIVFNTLQISIVRAKDLEAPVLDKEEIADLIAQASDYRPFVEIGKKPMQGLSPYLRSYDVSCGWYLHVGFVRVDDTSFGPRHSKGTILRKLAATENTASIQCTNGRAIRVSGEGAGIYRTVRTMLRDAEIQLFIQSRKTG